jgi:hypothetical protein
MLLPFFNIKGQINTYSPYSSFGLGQLYNCNSVSNMSMGGLSISVSDHYSINYMNPATYSLLNETSFEIGLRSSFFNMSQDNLHQKNFVAGLSNIGLGFPISEKIGFAIGLSPYSSVGYNVTSQILIDDKIGPVDYTYSGSGGLNKFTIGASWELKKTDNMNISVGSNWNYFFGSIDKTTTISTTNSSINFREQQSNMVNDFNFDIGLLLNYASNDYIFNLGTRFTPKTNLESSNNVFQNTYITSGEYESFVDTILYVNGDQTYITMPFSYGIGLSVESRQNWLIGLDYNYTNWQNTNIGSYMEDKSEFIFGAQFIPNHDDIHNYFNRVEYKLGCSYGFGYLDLANATGLNGELSLLKDISVSAGLALPMNRVSSKANLGIRYGYRGYSGDNLIVENYFTFYLSMTLNEKWFKKRKID